ncbi:hypothetical protein MKW92_009721 [Papaver armeniacum]|nr:hypothetical protein MKW92_009721 [Papaver armeniacum]
MHPTDSNSNPRCTIILKVEQARADTTGDIVYTDRFDSEEWELDYSCTAEQIKFEIGNLLDRFRITDGDYVESISERLSVDAAAHLRQAETLGVSVVIMEYVCISRKLERMRYLDGEDEVCCGICMEGIIGEDKVIKMKCSHILHSHCLERWLQVGYSCPLCRRHLKLCQRCETELAS